MSKSAASEKEKTTLETRLRDNETDLQNMHASISPLEDEIKERELLLSEKLKVIYDKDESIFRRDEIIKEQGDITKKRDHDFHSLFEQVSQKDDTIRQLRETIRVRDERLREKDEILQKMNINIDVKQKEMSDMDDTVLKTISKLNIKEEEVQKLKSKILHAESNQIACATDYEKENLRLKSKLKEFKDTLDTLKDENEDHCSCLQNVKDDFKFKETVWIKEKCDLQAMANQSNEKYKLLEITCGAENNDKIRVLKQTALKQIDEKEKTAASLIQVRREHEHSENAHRLEKDILKSSLMAKAKLVEENSTMMDRLNQELDRLQIQVSSTSNSIIVSKIKY